ncbi:MAG: Bax inhibitor-1/YccA family protein [Euzebya sp.]
MRTSNPALSESAFNRLGQTEGGFTTSAPYIQTGVFTVEGAIYKTGLLLAILIAAGVAAGILVPVSAYLPVLIGCSIVGLVMVLGISFKPNLAPTLAPVYAVVEGALLGVITVLIESQPGLDDIATQAVLGTVGVLAVMLTLYKTGVIKVTQRFRMVVMAATGAIFVTYLASFILGFFGINFGFLHGNSLLSIGISLVIIGVAALNLALDFDFIERAAAAGLPSKTEWYAAFGLLVTLVWLYLEILRLLAKLQSRD